MDESVIRSCRQGDRKAFARLVAAYQKDVYNLALRITGDREEAKDSTQDVFIKVFSAIATYRGEASFKTWLYRLATNVCIDRYRRRLREMKRAGPLDEAHLLADDDRGTNPGPALDSKERERMVRQAVLELPPDMRIALVLQQWQGCSYEEISRITGAPVNTVASRVRRAKLALKERLAPLLDGGDTE